MKLLILLVIILAVIAIAQLTKVYELSRSLRKNKEEEISAADNKLNANLMLVWMFLFFVGTVFLYVRYGDYLPVSASEHGADVDKLMKALDDESNETLLNFTTDKLRELNFKILNELHLSKKYTQELMRKLKDYK